MRSTRRPALILAALVIAAAFVIRAALPLGWMPMSTYDGIRVLLCSGKGAIELPLHKPGNDAADTFADAMDDPVDGDGDLPRDPCPFGVSLAKAFDLPSPVEIPAMPAIAATARSPDAITARIVAARSIRPPARGPPALA